MTPTPAPNTRLPASIWALGFVSLLMDISSEMIHSRLTKPSAQMLAGRRVFGAGVGVIQIIVPVGVVRAEFISKKCL